MSRRHGIVESAMFWGCVKSLFRLAKLKWGELCITFYRDERQQNYLVWIAMGVYNKLIHKSCNKILIWVQPVYFLQELDLNGLMEKKILQASLLRHC